MKKKAKPQPKTGTIWFVRGMVGGYLSTRKMSLEEALAKDDEDSVYLGFKCRPILGLPLPKRQGALLRMTWTVDTPKPKAKKKSAKATKKKKGKR